MFAQQYRIYTYSSHSRCSSVPCWKVQKFRDLFSAQHYCPNTAQHNMTPANVKFFWRSWSVDGKSKKRAEGLYPLSKSKQRERDHVLQCRMYSTYVLPFWILNVRKQSKVQGSRSQCWENILYVLSSQYWSTWLKTLPPATDAQWDKLDLAIPLGKL